MTYKLMLLDDEPILLEGLARQTDWQAYGFELVCTARHGFDGLEKFMDYQPDAVMTDIRMRFMNGLDFIRQVRRLDPDVEIAVMSAYDVFEYAQQACELGVTDYLLKPIAEEKLAGVLRTMHQRLDERRSVASRLKQAERYVIEQRSTLQAVARKRMLLGDANAETLRWADPPALRPGERMHVAMIQDNQEQDAQLLSVPVEQLFADRMGDCILMRCMFDNGAICIVLRAGPESAGSEQRLIEQSIADVRRITRETLTVTLGCDVDCWENIAKSYHSAEEQMHFARMLGMFGLVSLPAAAEDGRYPRELEKSLLEMISGSTPERLKKWSERFAAWSDGHPRQYAFAARGMFLRALQRLVELDEIGIGEYEQWRQRLESALILPGQASAERFVELAGQLLDGSQRESGRAGNYLSVLTERVGAFAAERLSDPGLNIRVVAEQVHVSAPYLGRIFKRVQGQSFSGYLNDLRLEQARLLLLDPNMRVGDVAAAVGFENQSYFQVLFKKKTGMTPGDYRARQLSGGGETQ